MPIFTKLLVIKIDANKILGCSNKLTILLKEGCFLVFKIFISFGVSEKKATSLPAIKNDNKNNIRIVTIRIVVAAGEIVNKLKALIPKAE